MADYRIEMINGFPVIIDNNTNFKSSTTALPCFRNEMEATDYVVNNTKFCKWGEKE